MHHTVHYASASADDHNDPEFASLLVHRIAHTQTNVPYTHEVDVEHHDKAQWYHNM